MHSHLLDYWLVVRIRFWWIFFVFLLVVGSAAIVTYFAPRQYRALATIEVQADMTPIHMVDNQLGQQPGDDRIFTQTQVEIIFRKGVLDPVIDRLDLRTKWARNGKALTHEAAYQRMRSLVSVEAIRNTNLIQISAESRDPQEAALLANTIAEVYMEQRIAEQKAIVSKSLDQLRDELKHKEQAVSAAYAEASKLRTEQKIIDPNPDGLENSGTYRVEDSSVISNQEKVNEAKSQVVILRSRLEQLDHLRWEDLIRGASQLNLSDPAIQAELPLYQAALVEKAKMLNSGDGANNPNIKALQSQIDAIEAQLRQQIDSVRKGLATQLAIAENSLKALEANLDASQTEQLAMKTASAEYLNAKYKYIQERKLLELAETRLNAESMELRMPQSAAFIRDWAEAPTSPS
jgi:polysaccharide biosynthesis transport protein